MANSWTARGQDGPSVFSVPVACIRRGIWPPLHPSPEGSVRASRPGGSNSHGHGSHLVEQVHNVQVDVCCARRFDVQLVGQLQDVSKEREIFAGRTEVRKERRRKGETKGIRRSPRGRGVGTRRADVNLGHKPDDARAAVAMGSTWTWNSHLQAQLTKHAVITESNRDQVVEILRAVAELMIWGDQHNSSFFDFFLEHKMLAHFVRILSQGNNRRGRVPVQLLQTLSIMIQNIKSETAIYYLFSNNYINELISYQFDFSDEEVLAYYISFLKTLSLKLNDRTVQFFFSQTDGVGHFPLYELAIKHHRNPESMVRAAVRTLTLQVYALEDEDVRKYVTEGECSGYIREVAQCLSEQVTILRETLPAVENGTSGAAQILQATIAEVGDLLCYCSDMLSMGCGRLTPILVHELWERLCIPNLFQPLSQYKPGDTHKLSQNNLLCTLYLLGRFIHLVTHPGLLNSTVALLLLPGGDAAQFCTLRFPKFGDSKEGVSERLDSVSDETKGDSADLDESFAPDFRGKLIATLAHENDQLVASVLAILVAALQNRSMDDHLLRLSGLVLPRENDEPSSMKSPTSEDIDKSIEGLSNMRLLNDTSDAKFAASHEILESLIPVFKTDLAKYALWHLGWLVKQLLPSEPNSGGRCSQLSEEQIDLLEEVYSFSKSELLEELQGPWCDALGFLMKEEWPQARKSVTFPYLGGDNVHILMSDRNGAFLNFSNPIFKPSATSAAQARKVVQKFLSLHLVRHCLLEGPLPTTPPAALNKWDWNFNTGIEGTEVTLGALAAIPCRIAFARGSEKHVYITVLTNTPCPGSSTIILAEPSALSMGMGTIISTAPVAGSDPIIDKGHPSWLHVRVRPPLNSLLSSSRRRLVDGRWTVAFADSDRCSQAKEMLEEQVAVLRAVSCDWLSPMLEETNLAMRTPYKSRTSVRRGEAHEKDQEDKGCASRSVDPECVEGQGKEFEEEGGRNLRGRKINFDMGEEDAVDSNGQGHSNGAFNS